MKSPKTSMQVFIISVLSVFLGGCASQMHQSPLGLDYVEVRQFFTNTSLSDADSVAQLYCANRNKSAKYMGFERGGPNLIDVERLGSFEYGRGGRYHIYTYQCVTPY
jgi:hypothetical protein